MRSNREKQCKKETLFLSIQKYIRQLSTVLKWRTMADRSYGRIVQKDDT